MQDNNDEDHEDDDEVVVGLPDDLSQPSKARTMFLMRLNIAAYPLCVEKLQHGHHCSYSEDTLKKVLEHGQSLYGSNVTTFEEELQAVKDFESHNWVLLKQLQEQKQLSFRSRSIPEETAEFDIGVSAVEWEIRNATTILVFRGTFTRWDYANIEHWMMDYALEKSTARMKEAWVNDAGLEWTKEMQDRSENHDDTWEKVALRAHQLLNEEKFPEELEKILASNASLEESLGGDDGNGHAGLTLEDARGTGYWKLTKHIVDQVYAETLARNQSLILTGHSQGATRAQLASMYLQKEYGVQIPTVSFAATGAACMARLLFDTSANLLQDVDPYSGHDQIVEYVHPLDVWGNSMLGEDGTRTCFISSKTTMEMIPIANETTATDPAQEYCSQVYGWPGPILLANEHSPILVDEELKRNFQRCRYFTHNTVAIFSALSYSLRENGATAIRNTTATKTVGGCADAKLIPKADPDGICPTGHMTSQEEEAFGLLLAIVLVTTFLSFALCYKCWIRNRQIRGYQASFNADESFDRAESRDTASIELPALT
ncbi:unnamed protein product [Cylindrotheca closterium]|uniref:Fungal lipase-type domain-containing protein n=1 Tax=Cylindrotheca closterium TaxID=2856 RepID=A0AAD2CF18_9STRA|nr:unnamed protein product [Cylindrotheca closterium]